MIKKKSMIYLLALVVIAVILIIFKEVGNKESLSEVKRLPQKGNVILEVEYLQGEGFVGILIENNSTLEIEHGEKIRVVFEENTKITQVDGTTFEYNVTEPNAMNCNLPKGTNVQATFESYEYIKSLEVPFRVYPIAVECQDL